MEAARRVLSAALESCPSHKTIWEGAIWFEETIPGEDRAQRVMALYERALSQPTTASAGAGKADSTEGQPNQEDATGSKASLSDADILELSLRSVEFADMYGDAALLLQAEERHAASFMLPAHATAMPDSRKRSHGDATAVDGATTANGHVAKQAKVDSAATAAVAVPAAVAVDATGAAAVAPASAAAAAAPYPYPAAAPAGPAGYGAYAGYGYGQYGYGYGYGY